MLRRFAPRNDGAAREGGCSPVSRHPEAAAISAFTRVFDALWRPSKDAAEGGHAARAGVLRDSLALAPQDDGKQGGPSTTLLRKVIPLLRNRGRMRGQREKRGFVFSRAERGKMAEVRTARTILHFSSHFRARAQALPPARFGGRHPARNNPRRHDTWPDRRPESSVCSRTQASQNPSRKCCATCDAACRAARHLVRYAVGRIAADQTRERQNTTDREDIRCVSERR